MATIFGNNVDGRVIFHKGLRASVNVPPPPNAVVPLEIDPETNDALIRDIVVNAHRYRVVAGALLKDDAPVAVAVPSQFADDGIKIQAAMIDLDTIIGLSTITNTQILSALKLLARIARYVLKWIARQP